MRCILNLKKPISYNLKSYIYDKLNMELGNPEEEPNKGFNLMLSINSRSFTIIGFTPFFMCLIYLQEQKVSIRANLCTKDT